MNEYVGPVEYRTNGYRYLRTRQHSAQPVHWVPGKRPLCLADTVALDYRRDTRKFDAAYFEEED